VGGGTGLESSVRCEYSLAAGRARVALVVPFAGGDAKWRSMLPCKPFWKLQHHWELGLRLSKTRPFGT